MKILRPAEIYLLRMGRPVVPANLGGDSKSDSSTDTSNYTTNNVTNWDKRAVASDQAVSLTGDGNFLDRSATTNFYDTSNRSSLTSFVDSSNRSTSFFDASNKSTNFADSSNNSTNFMDKSVSYDSSWSTSDSSTNFTDNSNRSTNHTTTDFGAINAAMAGMTQATTGAYNLSGNVVKTAQDIMLSSASSNQQLLNSAFSIASASNNGSLKNSADVLGFAQTSVADTQAFARASIAQVKDAFADAKDGGTSKIMLAVLGVVAVIGVAVALK